MSNSLLSIPRLWADFEASSGKILDGHGADGAGLRLVLQRAGRLVLFIVAVGFVLLAVGGVWLLVFSGYTYLNRLLGAGPYVPIWVPIAVCALLTILILVFFGLFDSRKARSTDGVALAGVPLWQLLVIGPLLVMFALVLGAWQSETVNGAVDRVRDRTGTAFTFVACYIPSGAASASACLDRFPEHPQSEIWRRLREDFIASKYAEADNAYAAAADVTSGYSDPTFEAARVALEAALQVDGDHANAQLATFRLRAVEKGPRPYTECNGCPQMRVILPLSDLPPFSVALFETSVGEWDRCVAAQACAPIGGGDDDVPASNMRGEQIGAYLFYLSALDGAPQFRLPSAAEWRYAAAMGGNAVPVPARQREQWVCSVANSLNGDAVERQAPPANGNSACDDTYPPGELAPANPERTSEVGRRRFAPNALGVFHMVGNVSEWTTDTCEFPWRGRPMRGRTILGGANTDRPRFDENGLVIEQSCDGLFLGARNRGFRVVRSFE